MSFQGDVKQYRLFRAHVNFGPDSMLYPYDTQMPTLKLRSLDYGNNEIVLTTKVLNNLNQIDLNELDVKDVTDLANIQDRFRILMNLFKYGKDRFSKTHIQASKLFDRNHFWSRIKVQMNNKYIFEQLGD